MIYGYGRVSTKGQAKDSNSLEAQERLLKEHGAEEIYMDSFTGTKMNRPEFNKLLELLQDEDTLVVAKLDRFARSVSQASDLITNLIDKGVCVDVCNLGVLDNSSMSTLMRNILLSFAQFERDMIVEPTQEGKAIARQNPEFREGRPKKYSKAQISHAVELLDNYSYRQVEAMTGISKSKELLDRPAEYKPLAKIEELEECNYNMIDNILNNEKPKEEKEKQTGRISIREKLAEKKAVVGQRDKSEKETEKKSEREI